MSAVDGTPLGGRVRLLAEAQDVIVAYARHRNIESLTDAASRYILEFAPLVEDRASLPVSPGDGREGAATATAAPSVLKPLPDYMAGAWCTVDPPKTKLHDATWMCWPNACCDEHIPDGWVKPDDVPLTLEESKALHPSSRPVVEYVKACVYCGERSQHGRCS